VPRRNRRGACTAAASLALLLWPALALAQSAPRVQGPATPSRVIVVYWYGGQYPANVAFERGFQEVLQGAHDRAIEYHAEYFESDRFPEEQQDRVLHDYLRRKYEGLPIDVVVGTGSAANAFLDRHRSTLFPDAPRVFIGAPAAEAGAVLPGTTGIAVFSHFRSQIDLARRLHPRTNRAFVVSGTLSHDKSIETLARAQLAGYAPDVAITYLTDLGLDALVASVRALPPRSVIVYAWQQSLSRQGTVLESTDVARAIAPFASVPIYAMSSSQIGNGFVGGDVFSTEGNGRQAARIALRLLGGARPESIPVERPSTAPTFDWRAVRRWGIPEERLPRGATLLNRDATIWDRYQRSFFVAAGVCALQLGLIVALLIQRASRKRAEAVALARQRELTHLSRVATVGELTGALAHEIGQPLTAIQLNAKAAQRLLARGNVDLGKLKDAVDQIVQGDMVAFDVIARIRQLLRKKDCTRTGIDLNELVTDTLTILATELESRAVSVTTVLETRLPEVSGDAVELQQVMMNLVLNACDAMGGMPADRRALTMRTIARAEGAEVAVTDRGTGIPADSIDDIFEPFFTTRQDGLGLGLAICRRIVAAHGGRMWAENNDEMGATFRFRLPTEQSGAAGTPVRATEHAARGFDPRAPVMGIGAAGPKRVDVAG
jgi:signal transduction histidine kinase